MIFLKNRNTRALIVIMGALVLIGLLIANGYYKNLNSKIDPRIIPARNLYEKYNHFAQQNNFDSVLYLMDTIERIYQQFPHYQNSFEVGVLNNNRTACYLTMAMISNDSIYKDSCLLLAENNVKKSIDLYNSWGQKFSSQDADSIQKIVELDFYKESNWHNENKKKRYLQNRIKEIEQAHNELNRRLSVSHTNYGMVHRQRVQLDSAANHYVKAIELWDRNLTAENNLNILLGKPLKKRNIIQRLFPPKKK